MDTIERRTNTASPAPTDPLALDPLGPIAPRPRRLEDTPMSANPLDPIVSSRTTAENGIRRADANEVKEMGAAGLEPATSRV